MVTSLLFSVSPMCRPQSSWMSPVLHVTFLAEALPTVLAAVRLLSAVELHVVPQGARVGQQFGADCTLKLEKQMEQQQSISFVRLFASSFLAEHARESPGYLWGLRVDASAAVQEPVHTQGGAASKRFTTLITAVGLFSSVQHQVLL